MLLNMRQRLSRVLAAIVSLLLISGIPVFFAQNLSRAESQLSHDDRILLVGGLISANFDGEHLAAILKELERQGAFHLQISDEIADFQIYGDFIDIPLASFLEEILPPLNYVLVLPEQGGTGTLILSGYGDSVSSVSLNADVSPTERDAINDQPPGLNHEQSVFEELPKATSQGKAAGAPRLPFEAPTQSRDSILFGPESSNGKVSLPSWEPHLGAPPPLHIGDENQK
jgi:hypothetical protein